MKLRLLTMTAALAVGLLLTGCSDDNNTTVVPATDTGGGGADTVGGDETTGGGTCTTDAECTASSECTVASCSAAGVCEEGNRPDGAACDDGNPCTDSATCTAGACGGGTAVAANCGTAVCGQDACGNDCGSCGTGQTCSAGQCTGEATCTAITADELLEADTQYVGSFYGTGITPALGGADDDFISFELYTDATGSFDFSTGINNNYETCDQCIVIYEDATQSGIGRQYYPTSGVMDVDPANLPSSGFIGITLTDVKFIEVTIDDTSYLSTPVAGGACLTLSGTFSTGVCEADCTDRVCGDDGCGGSCGDCGTDELCDGLGQCKSTDEAVCATSPAAVAEYGGCTDDSGDACICVGCVDDGACNNDDCVCGDCAEDSYCVDNCNEDGLCDPFFEGCGCSDCALHPECGGVVTPDAGPEVGPETTEVEATEDTSGAESIEDAGTTDTVVTDAGTVDAGTVDAGTVDAGTVDAGTVDAGTADVGPVDAGTADADATDPGA